MTTPKYHRVLLKLSGEALLGEQKFGISATYVRYLAEEIRKVRELDTQVSVVVGGGNILRGAEAAEHGIEEATAHYMGMLGTVMNALALHSQLATVGVEARVQTALEMNQVAEPYIRLKAISHLEKGRVVIFAAGTGNPFFTTDTAATLRAAEIGAEVILMGKNKVDGVYDSDPNASANARKYASLDYREMLAKQLKVIDATAAALAEERRLPIIVFDLSQAGAMARAVMGEQVGTLVHASR